MLHLVLDTIPVRVFWKDVNLNYLGCNKLFAKDAGFQHPEEIIGLNDYNLGWKNEAHLYQRDDKKVIEISLKIKYFIEKTLNYANIAKYPLKNRGVDKYVEIFDKYPLFFNTYN